MPLSLSVVVERWPVKGRFAISRGAKSQVDTVTALIADGPHTGRGECVPYARYGETVAGVVQAIERMRERLTPELHRNGLQEIMPPGAARNALDCALWDLEAKRTGTRAHARAGLPSLHPCVTAYTISLDTPSAMAAAAERAAGRPLLKVKLGGAGDPERIRAVRKSAPDCELIVDANEAWTCENFAQNLSACADAGVTLIEQPLPAGADDYLAHCRHAIAVCADESVHDRKSLPALCGKYDAINIKLDKTGGFTEALAVAESAEQLGFAVMVGCMVATSLAMAPAMLVAQRARTVDLDGPLLLAADRPAGLRYEESFVHPPDPSLWG
jgi:L-Ala-D/L-Glu epimerase / N-acetyl-D-glutamate racemase